MKKQIPKSILYVCTGNTCRSPMAEHLTIGMAKQKGLELVVGSRGMIPCKSFGFGLDVALDSCNAVLEIFPQSKIYTHRPRVLTFEDIDKFEVILTMTESLRDEIIGGSGGYIYGLTQKVFTLMEYAGYEAQKSKYKLDIPDPAGRGIFLQIKSDAKNIKPHEKYIKIRYQIMKCVKRILDGKHPSTHEIFEKREKIAQQKDIEDYELILDKIMKKNKGKIYVCEEELKIINKVREGKDIPGKKHLYPIIDQILYKAQEKGIKLK